MVHQFTNPTQAPVKASTKGDKIGKSMYTVKVYNGSGIDGYATNVATQLVAQGYNAEAVADAYEYPDTVTAVYAPASLESQAETIAAMLWPSDVRIVPRAQGTSDGISVFVASTFDGTIEIPEEVVQEQQQTLEKGVKYDWASWQATDAETPLKLEAPTAWPSGSTYSQFRNYSIERDDGKHSAASVAVARTPRYGYWNIQAMRWLDPPAIENPNSTADDRGAQVHALLPGRPPAHGRLEGARDAVLGAEHPGQPALERPHDGHREVLQAREVSWLRAVARRLDPWAALLLGGLLAMGVVILLATPGPWQRVVGQEPPVRLEAPAPDDVALFVMGGRGGSCSGIVWLHLDAERQALTAVVVAPRVSGFSPTDGYAPLAAIAGSAGPSAAAEALGGALGVSMDAWIALDRKALDLAVEPMFPMNEVRAARTRYRAARAAWRGLGGDEDAWATQYESLRVALPQVAFEELGVVAFSNYVLGFGFVRSDLTLQGATSLAGGAQRSRPQPRGGPRRPGGRGALPRRRGVARGREPGAAAAPVARAGHASPGDRDGSSRSAPGPRASS